MLKHIIRPHILCKKISLEETALGQKENTSSTGIDITCTRLSVVFLMRKTEHKLPVSRNPLGGHINEYSCKPYSSFSNYII